MTQSKDNVQTFQDMFSWNKDVIYFTNTMYLFYVIHFYLTLVKMSLFLFICCLKKKLRIVIITSN